MTGLPEFNYPAFIKGELKLQKAGYTVVNPARLNTAGETWTKCLRNDLKHIVTKCDAVVVMDNNWFNSRGARLEVATAIQLGMPIISLRTLKITEIHLMSHFYHKRNKNAAPRYLNHNISRSTSK